MDASHGDDLDAGVVAHAPVILYGRGQRKSPGWPRLGMSLLSCWRIAFKIICVACELTILFFPSYAVSECLPLCCYYVVLEHRTVHFTGAPGSFPALTVLRHSRSLKRRRDGYEDKVTIYITYTSAGREERLSETKRQKMSYSQYGRPTQFHNVPLEERAFDSKGNRLPWSLEWPE